jgi:hypothetical protein
MRCDQSIYVEARLAISRQTSLTLTELQMTASSVSIRRTRNLVVFFGLVVLFGCGKGQAPPRVTETQPSLPPPATAPEPAKPAPPPELSQPKPHEVQAAVKRVFKDAVAIDASHNPSFMIGDFNGDTSPDLAVILKPADGKLSELNGEFPSWIAREPLKDILLPKSKALARPVPVRANASAGQTIRFEQGDVLLAIIHGVGSNGWQDPEATQTHLLRGVVGAEMHTMALSSVAKAYKGVKPFPTIYGDLIQQSLVGQAGFLYFNGGIYAWYDPKNFDALPVTGHAGMSAMR